MTLPLQTPKHTRPVRFRTLVLLALLGTGCDAASPPSAPADGSPDRSAAALQTSLGLGALAAFLPAQAILLDGSTDAEDAYGIAFDANVGYQLHLGASLFACPDTEHRPQQGTFQVFAGRGIFQPVVLLTDLLPVAVDPRVLPAELQALGTDCELLGQLAALNNYLSAVAVAVAQALAQVQACQDSARELYCQVVAAIEAAPTLTVGEIDLVSLLGDDVEELSSVAYGPEECHDGLQRLHQIPTLLKKIDWSVQRCLKVKQNLLGMYQGVTAFVQTFGGLTESMKEELLLSADAKLAQIAECAAAAAQTAAELDLLTAWLTAGNLQASCDLCDESTPGFTGLVPSGVVHVLFRRQSLDRYVEVLRSSARAATDREQAARLKVLAHRLATVATRRVMQVVYPSASVIGQEHVAVWPAGVRDDGVSPLVVVLTALPAEASLPGMNTADLELLFDAFNQFRATVGGRRR